MITSFNPKVLVPRQKTLRTSLPEEGAVLKAEAEAEAEVEVEAWVAVVVVVGVWVLPPVKFKSRYVALQTDVHSKLSTAGIDGQSCSSFKQCPYRHAHDAR